MQLLVHLCLWGPFLLQKRLEQQLAQVTEQRDKLEAELGVKTHVVEQLLSALAETKQDVARVVRGAVDAYTEQLNHAKAECAQLEAEVSAPCA